MDFEYSASSSDALKALKKLYEEFRSTMLSVNVDASTSDASISYTTRSELVRQKHAKLDLLVEQFASPPHQGRTKIKSISELWKMHGRTISYGDTVGVHSWSCHTTLSALAEIGIVLSRPENAAMSPDEISQLYHTIIYRLHRDLNEYIVERGIRYSGRRDLKLFMYGDEFPHCRMQQRFEREAGLCRTPLANSNEQRSHLRLVHSVDALERV